MNPKPLLLEKFEKSFKACRLNLYLALDQAPRFYALLRNCFHLPPKTSRQSLRFARLFSSKGFAVNEFHLQDWLDLEGGFRIVLFLLIFYLSDAAGLFFS